MNIEEAKKNIDEIEKIFKEIETAYGIDLTRHVTNCLRVKDDLDDAVWKVKHKDGCGYRYERYDINEDYFECLNDYLDGTMNV